MVLLGTPEIARRHDFCDDWPAKLSRFRECFLGRNGRSLLFGRVVEDDGSVLRSYIRPLPVWCGWVVVLPKNAEQLIVGNARRIKLHLNHFGMAGPIRANIFVARVFQCSTRITDSRGRDSFHLSKSRLHAPKTSSSKCGFLHSSSLAARSAQEPSAPPVTVTCCRTDVLHCVQQEEKDNVRLFLAYVSQSACCRW